jgi:hypothetical protein
MKLFALSVVLLSRRFARRNQLPTSKRNASARGS